MTFRKFGLHHLLAVNYLSVAFGISCSTQYKVLSIFYLVLFVLRRSCLLDIATQGCWAGGGSANTKKLLLFLISRLGSLLRYNTGEVHTSHGTIPLQTSCLQFAGIPIVQGDVPRATLDKALARLRRLHQCISRLRPSYPLTLRIVAAFGIAGLDSVADAIPFEASWLVPIQRALDACLTSALRIPRTAPRRLLYVSPNGGGFGFPNLSVRFRIRHTHAQSLIKTAFFPVTVQVFFRSLLTLQFRSVFCVKAELALKC